MIMMKTLLGGVAFAVAMLATPGTALAQTTTITFEGSVEHHGPITRQGFVIGNPAGQEQHWHEIMGGFSGTPSNGTVMLLNDRDTQIFVQSEIGALFSLLSVDVGPATGTGAALGLTISGYLDGVLTKTIEITFKGGFETWDASSLGMVDRVVFDGIDGRGGFVLDNLVLATPAPGAVPEPATWAMMLLGFGAIGFQARRTKRALARAAG